MEIIFLRIFAFSYNFIIHIKQSSSSQCALRYGYLLYLPFPIYIDLYTLLLEDILVLSQKQDERLVLKCHSKNLAANADTKHTFSPIIKLSAVLVREVATG